MLLIIEHDFAAEIVEDPAVLLESVFGGQRIAVGESGILPAEQGLDLVFDVGIGPSHIPHDQLAVMVESAQSEIAGGFEFDDFIDRFGIERIWFAKPDFQHRDLPCLPVRLTVMRSRSCIPVGNLIERVIPAQEEK